MKPHDTYLQFLPAVETIRNRLRILQDHQLQQHAATTHSLPIYRLVSLQQRQLRNTTMAPRAMLLSLAMITKADRPPIPKRDNLPWGWSPSLILYQTFSKGTLSYTTNRLLTRT